MDQFYFDNDYLVDDYFGYIAEAQATLDGAMTATMSADIADDTGYYIPDYIEVGYIDAGGVTQEASASLDVSASIIADASAQKETSATLTTNADILSTANLTVISDAQLSTQATLTADVEGITFVELEATELPIQTTLSANAIEYIAKTIPFGRPNPFLLYFWDASASTWYPDGNSNFNSDVVAEYKSTGQTVPPLLEYAFTWQEDSPGQFNDTQAVASTLDTPIDISTSEDFTINVNIDRDKDGSVPATTDWFTDEVILVSIGDGFNNVGTSQIIDEDTTNKINIGLYRIADDTVVPYARVGNTQLYGSSNFGFSGWITLTRDNGTLKLYNNATLLDSASNTNSITDIDHCVLYYPEKDRAIMPAYDRFYFAKGISRAGVTNTNVHTTFINDIDTTVVLAQFEQNLDDDLNFLLRAEADLNITATQTVTGTLLADITALEAGTFALSADIELITQGQATLTTSATLDATTGFIQSADATLDAFVTEIVVINKIGNTLIDIPMITTLTSDVSKFIQLESALNTAATQSTNATKTALYEANIQSTSTISADADRIRNVDSALNSSFNLVASANEIIQLASALNTEFTTSVNGIINVEAQAALDTDIAIAADNLRVRFAQADLDFIGSELTAVGKIGDFLITLDSSSTMLASAVVKTGSVIALDTASTITTDAQRLRSDIASLDSAFIQTASGIINVEGNSNINVSSSLVADASKITDVQIAIQGAMSFAAVAKGNLAGEIDLDTVTTLTADAVAFRGVQADLNVLASVQAQQTTIRQTDANFNLSISITVDGRIITLLEELEYVIPQETREYAIRSETREYAIEFENREHII